MFAVIKTGGKQFRVAANDRITIAKLEGNPGDTVAFGSVLMLTDGDKSTVGAPFLGDITVAGEIVEQTRGEKVIAFKKRRRQNSKRKRGFRAELTVVRITDILTGGKKPEMKKGEVAPVALKAGSEAVKGKAAAKPAKAKAEAKAEGLDASNLSLISGVGPTIEKKLRAAGITSWNDIAAWTEADVAKWDEELKLRGRATREEWVEQAKELLAGKPPRAKVDQAEQASGEDY
ncbi:MULTISPECIES: 50S ribosomal protein L21 [unclassified Bosea (in: a-proteobacteria)]|uniref:50S ribosomal protein L21 n=1 Tax=unclassified Bosea (in: a-proteobacteria) TaxID=2653178 RepID=UPI000F756A80|nr:MULTISPECIES: 50S ribosomal protein L21 [unclassified Bosea (in: a-proteobacteria)]AZO80653.1 50S ribosomal protein L21 [Bosea sp. Tri-49]RXT25614.1 50S ribosomal protein L21 [Bosea sp. Tri-39]RXT30855.1 50S ribosomal protein L21 [Bosea sp. Tri-54]